MRGELLPLKMWNHTEVAVTVDGLDHGSAVMAFSLRNGGRSSGAFRSLNFSRTQGDSLDSVSANFRIFGDRFGLDPARIVAARQVHGDDIALVNALPALGLVADAVVTTSTNIFPAVKTADCLPILLLDPARRVSAAVHAGWRGTVCRITAKVVRFLRDSLGCRPADLRAALGPAIGPCCYEVDEVVLGPFRRGVPDADCFIRRVVVPDSRRPSFRLDLTGANRQDLLSEGVPIEHISESGLCTFCREDLLFSYRRDGATSGRHIAVVGFTE